MSAHEFAEWQAYAQIEPFGEVRADLRNAMLASLVAGALGVRDFDPWSFMPFTEKPGAGDPGPVGGLVLARAYRTGRMAPEAARPESPRGPDPDPEGERERKGAEIYDRLRTWAIMERAKAEQRERREGVKSGDPV